MTIYCLGSINADYFYDLDHMPTPGETLSSLGHHRGLGGKGTNQSVAAARAGADVVHIGAIGADGLWAKERLVEFGVIVDAIATSSEATGHAIILLDSSGENSIILHGGANRDIAVSAVLETISKGKTGDILLLQNETNAQVEAAEAAAGKGMKVLYSAAPFDVDAVTAVLGFVDVLIMNEIEDAQLKEAYGPLPDGVATLVTMGAEGAVWSDGAEKIHVPAIKVTPVDTTGAGDTFAGYFAAGLASGKPAKDAMELASAAAALKVTRKGTADAIPSLDEVVRFQE